MPAQRPIPILPASLASVDFEEAFERTAAPLSIFEIREHDVVLLRANAAARTELGLPGTELAGPRIDAALKRSFDLASLRRLIHPDDFDTVAAYFASLGPAPAAASVMLRVARPEGGWRWLEARGSALTFDARGAPRLVLGVASDITERRAMSRALDRATRAVLRAGDVERRRFARNLHDSTAQHLVAIDLGLTGLERRLPPGAETAAILRDIRVSLTAAHREVRTYSYLLHPPQLQRLGLEGALRRLIEGFGRRAELTIDIEVVGPPQAVRAEVELVLFRVAQEAIMNVHRHAQATRASLRLLRAPKLIVLEVEDDGVGLPDLIELGGVLDDSQGDGVGIPGMQARVAQAGGTLELLRRERGLCVRAELPL
ncbi:MAG TPA: histidine kinase [Caulobacteraceae bacterium]|nr:histidine kinase [Caulobacteraceae bacterium]